jgi:hypothetical protein
VIDRKRSPHNKRIPSRIKSGSKTKNVIIRIVQLFEHKIVLRCNLFPCLLDLGPFGPLDEGELVCDLAFWSVAVPARQLNSTLTNTIHAFHWVQCEEAMKGLLTL